MPKHAPGKECYGDPRLRPLLSSPGLWEILASRASSLLSWGFQNSRTTASRFGLHHVDGDSLPQSYLSYSGSFGSISHLLSTLGPGLTFSPRQLPLPVTGLLASRFPFSLSFIRPFIHPSLTGALLGASL